MGAADMPAGEVPLSYVNSLVSYGRESADNLAELKGVRNTIYRTKIALGKGQLLAGTLGGSNATQQHGLTYQQEFDAHTQALDRIAKLAPRRMQARIY